MTKRDRQSAVSGERSPNRSQCIRLNPGVACDEREVQAKSGSRDDAVWHIWDILSRNTPERLRDFDIETGNNDSASWIGERTFESLERRYGQPAFLNQVDNFDDADRWHVDGMPVINRLLNNAERAC